MGIDSVVSTAAKVVVAAGTTTVKAIARGFYQGPREPGDVFEMPLKKDGSEPTGSWFEKVAPLKKAALKGKVLTDDDLA